MKQLPSVILLSALVLFAGCSSLDRPFGSLFRSGRDARVFNAQTGEYEWPEDTAQSRKNRPVASPAEAQRKTDGRYYDVSRNEWVQAPAENSGPASTRPPARPEATIVSTAPTVVVVPPERPSSATGIYNPSTGQIEWGTGPAVPRSTAAPSRKKWYWPF